MSRVAIIALILTFQAVAPSLGSSLRPRLLTFPHDGFFISQVQLCAAKPLRGPEHHVPLMQSQQLPGPLFVTVLHDGCPTAHLLSHRFNTAASPCPPPTSAQGLVKHLSFPKRTSIFLLESLADKSTEAVLVSVCIPSSYKRGSQCGTLSAAQLSLKIQPPVRCRKTTQDTVLYTVRPVH